MLQRLRVLVVVCLVAVGSVVSAAPASAKAYAIAAIQVEATLNADGSMQVVEHLTYDFQGQFRNGTRPIPPGDYYSIVDMRVSENGVALPTSGAPYDLSWRYDARDERRTFDIAYTVLGAAQVGPDVGELNWKFVGEATPGVGEVRIAIDVPGDGLDVRAWGHGPLNGRVEVQGDRVLVSVSDLPSGRFVEARVTVPSEQFSVVPEGGDRLPGILATEQRDAAEANRSRAREDQAAERRATLRRLVRDWYWIVPILGALVFIELFRRFGREHRAVDDVGEYLREPPDDPPAYVPTLFGWGTVEPIVLSATIVDLAQRGYLTIEEKRQDRFLLGDKIDWLLTRQPSDDPVTAWEYVILARLFADGPEITQSEFAAWCRTHRTEADRWWTDVKTKVVVGFNERHYIEGGKGLVFGVNVVVGAAVIGSGIYALSLGAVIGLAGVLAGAVQLALTAVLRRRTPAGAQRLSEWEAFKRFLEDFSQLEDAPVGHLILWERYLVYSVALGVSAQVARALAARIPAPADTGGRTTTRGFAPWFVGSHGPGALDSVGSFSGFAGGFGPEIVAAATPPSSSSSGSGGGGGFSGGGGGGGGGGGAGAS